MIFFNGTAAKKLCQTLSLIFLASVIITFPIFYFGIPNGNDLPQHYQFALTFHESLQNGSLYPGLSDASNFGFGDVGVRFYPPVSYYVLISFVRLTGNWFDASFLTFLFWFFLSGIGVYFWAREWFGENASLVAAIVYIFAPYHVNQIYNAFTYAEFAASAILPFCFLFVTRICRTGKFIDIIGLAVFYALLVLTHLPQTVIGSLALLVFSLASLPDKKQFQTLSKLAVSGLCGLFASAFYWIRMVSELSFINHATTEFTSKAYDFHSNFLAAFFSVSPIVYDERLLWFSNLMLLITFGLFIPSLVIFYCGAKDAGKPKLFAVGCLVIFSVFMATPLSLPIWENFGLLQKVQFPWRWLAVISMGGVIFIAAGFEQLVAGFKSKMRPFAILTVGLIVIGFTFTGKQIVNPAIFSSREEFTQKIENLREAESYICWWAVWSKKEAFSNREKISVADRTVKIEKWLATEKIFNVSSGAPQNARIAVFYYPHWKATVNGKPAEVKIAADGAILVPVNDEESRIKIWFEESPPARFGFYLSGFTWLIFLFTGLFYFVRKSFHPSKEIS